MAIEGEKYIGFKLNRLFHIFNATSQLDEEKGVRKGEKGSEPFFF